MDFGGHVVYVVEVYMQDKLFSQLTYTACPDFSRQEGAKGPVCHKSK